MIQFNEVPKEIKGFQSSKEIQKRSDDIVNLFKECISEIKKTKQVEFVILPRDVEPTTQLVIHIVGNKTVGSDYELTMHEKVPIFAINRQQFSFDQRLFYLDLRINFTGSMSSEDWKMSSDQMRLKMMKSLNSAIQDFVI